MKLFPYQIRGPKHRIRGYMLFALLSLIFLLSACGQPAGEHTATGIQDQQNGHEDHSPTRVNGDLRETTAGLNELPSFLDEQPDLLVQAYQVAAGYAEELEYIPCYCGCGDSVGHRNNKMCFIHEIKEDGSVVWDDHGTRCNVCVETAVLSAKMKYDGASLKEIRQFIDDKYSEGYASPTKTIMPEAE